MKSSTIRPFSLFVLYLLILPVLMAKGQDSWSHFRGDQLNSKAIGDNWPVEWNDSLNILWKAKIPGKGWSSPIVRGSQVWCTSASPDGKEMFAVCTNLETGEEIFYIPLFQPDTIHQIHAVNSYATPSPCMEDGFLYTHFGRYGTACINTENGEIVWKRSDLQCNHVQGPGSSLILFENKLILHLEGTDTRTIYALDKTTGEIIWQAGRPEEYYDKIEEIGKKAYITPIVITAGGRKLLISNGSAVCVAYDVETGKEVWRIPGGEDSTISMPVYENGMLYFYTSFVSPPEGEKYCELLAVKPEGSGDISRENIVWRKSSPILQLLTPVVSEGLLFTVDSEGVLYCLDAENGREIWSERLRGKFNSSPVIAGGKLYLNSTRGDCLIYNASEQQMKIFETRMKGEIWATPAFVNGTILLRTSEYLYRIGSKPLQDYK